MYLVISIGYRLMYITCPTYKKSKYIFIRIYDLFRILSCKMII